MDNLSLSCTCDPMLYNYVQNCNISGQTLSKVGSAWIGNDPQDNLSVIDPCPSDYCCSTTNIHVFHFDSQCNYNRVGVGCGQCAGNLSMTFGTSQCKPCTNVHLLLIVPFAFMGMALIVFLMVFNLTVSSGTINGIFLYAFVIRTFQNVFFPTSYGALANISDFLSIFVAWLNLDLGIETCFYHGMNSYSKVWLQFSFLFYIVVLVLAIITASKFSSFMSRVCRHNMVSVISTLVILLYAKLLRIVTTIFNYATVRSENISFNVWYYDSTMLFFDHQQTYLFTAGLLVTIFFILPYTAVMLLTPCLVTKSHWKVMCWMNKLKPFIDCYEAPFKDRYRFWTGATLFYRILFCVVFSFFSNNQPTIVLLIIIAIHASMIVMVGLALYKHWLVSLLEGFFHINIVLHSAVLFFLYNGNGHIISAVPTVIFVGSAFLCLLCILLFRILNYVKSNYINVHCLHYSRVINEDNTDGNMAPSAAHQINVSALEYVYREPLMSDNS